MFNTTKMFNTLLIFKNKAYDLKNPTMNREDSIDRINAIMGGGCNDVVVELENGNVVAFPKNSEPDIYFTIVPVEKTAE